MICYKDMTFCSNVGECKNGETCHRNLTEEEEERAYALDLAIAIASFKSTCKRWEKKDE